MSLPIEIWAHILQYLPLAKIHQIRQVSSTLDNAAELVLGDIYRKSSDWRYRYLLSKMHVFKVLPYLMRVRRKETSFKDTMVDVGPCSTETGTSNRSLAIKFYWKLN